MKKLLSPRQMKEQGLAGYGQLARQDALAPNFDLRRVSVGAYAGVPVKFLERIGDRV